MIDQWTRVLLLSRSAIQVADRHAVWWIFVGWLNIPMFRTRCIDRWWRDMESLSYRNWIMANPCVGFLAIGLWSVYGKRSRLNPIELLQASTCNSEAILGNDIECRLRAGRESLTSFHRGVGFTRLFAIPALWRWGFEGENESRL